MAKITDEDLEDLLADESDTQEIDPLKWNEIWDLFKDTINSLDSANIEDNSLTPEKFLNGAVTADQITTVGEENKILKTTSTGDIILKGSIKFIRE